jgi:hypothetical protein
MATCAHNLGFVRDAFAMWAAILRFVSRYTVTSRVSAFLFVRHNPPSPCFLSARVFKVLRHTDTMPMARERWWENIGGDSYVGKWAPGQAGLPSDVDEKAANPSPSSSMAVSPARVDG